MTTEKQNNARAPADANHEEAPDTKALNFFKHQIIDADEHPKYVKFAPVSQNPIIDADTQQLQRNEVEQRPCADVIEVA